MTLPQLYTTNANPFAAECDSNAQVLGVLSQTTTLAEVLALWTANSWFWECMREAFSDARKRIEASLPVAQYQCINPVKLTSGKAVMYMDIITAEEYQKVKKHDQKWFVIKK